jgi:hypothetical protein
MISASAFTAHCERAFKVRSLVEKSTSPVTRASSTGRCNTIQCVDSAMLPRENYLFGCTRPKPYQGSVLAALARASDVSFCFQYKGGSSLVLRRPIEITRLTRQVNLIGGKC